MRSVSLRYASLRGVGGFSCTTFDEAGAIRDALGADNVRTRLVELCDESIALRRLAPLSPPRTLGETGVPKSPLLSTDALFLFERGFERRAMIAGSDRDASAKPLRFARLPEATIARPSDMQLHEVFNSSTVVLRRAPKHLAKADGSQWRGKSLDYFHFVLFRQRLDLVNVIEFLSETTGGRIPVSAFGVNIISPDASGTVTQRLSVAAWSHEHISQMLKAANSLTSGDECRFIRLEPIGSFDWPCGAAIADGATVASHWQYTVLLRGIVGSPRKSLLSAGRAAAATIPNYFNPLHFGGTQSLLALSTVHAAIKEERLEEALAMLMNAASRSGCLSGMASRFRALLENDVLGTSTALRSIATDRRVALRAPWFSKGLSILTAPEGTVSQGELHETFHKDLPLTVRRAIKYSSSMLAWNASASCIISHYSEGSSLTPSHERPLLRLPINDSTGSALKADAIPDTFSFGYRSGCKLGGAYGAFDVPMCLPWCQDARMLRDDATKHPKVCDYPLPPTGVPQALLETVVLPVGFHSHESSLSNIGLVATGVEDSVASSFSGLRPLFIRARGVECFVCVGGTSESGHRGDSRSTQRFRSQLLTDASALLAKGSDSAPVRYSVANRVPPSVAGTMRLVGHSSAAPSFDVPHSLALKFELPPDTDPAAFFMSFVSVRSSLPFVPEDNGLHVATQPLGERRDGLSSRANAVASPKERKFVAVRESHWVPTMDGNLLSRRHT